MALAALVAVHPLLVYYAQEARGYAAVALACAVGFACFLDALEGRRAMWWALASAVALGCHYFAIFPVAIEAAILLARRGRAALPALGGVALAGAALLPLLAEQIGGDHAGNVTAGAGLGERVKAAATSWLVGERGAAIDNLEWLVGALLLAGVALVVRRRERAAILPAAVGGGAAALIGLAALGGADYLNNRNTLPRSRSRSPSPRSGSPPGGARAPRSAPPPASRCSSPRSARSPIPRTRARTGAPPRATSAPRPPWSWRRPTPTCRCAGTGRPSARRRPRAWGERAGRRPQRPRAQPAAAGALDAPPAPGFTPAGTRQHDRMLIARYRAATPQVVRPDAVGAWARTRLDAGRGAGGAALLVR